MDIANSPTLTTTSGFTVAFWYKAAANAGSIAAKPLGTGMLNSWQIEFLNSSTLSFTSSNGGTQHFDSVSAPSTGTWIFVAASWDGGTKRLYLDGTERLSVARMIVFDTSPVVIGGDCNSGSFVLPFNGLIDEVKMFNRALTASEIQTLYQEASFSIPVISSFSASPSAIGSGQITTLSWTVSGATSLAMDQGVGDVSGTTSTLVSPTTTTVYTLTATNTYGSVTQSFTVTVSSSGSTTSPGTFEETVFVSGLGTPTATEFAPDGRLFVAEQAGRLRMIKNGTLLSTPFLTLNA